MTLRRQANVAIKKADVVTERAKRKWFSKELQSTLYGNSSSGQSYYTDF